MVERFNQDLGPHLPMAVYYSQAPWKTQRMGALAVYCSDGRWGEAFDEFCHNHLQIPRYDRWAVPGGPACLVPREHNRDYCRTTWQQLDMLAQVHQLDRIVLIAHHGCAFYAEMLHRDPTGCLPTQIEDLHTGVQALRDWFKNMKVEAYLAMRQATYLSFHEV
jgi:hypothetical protein